MRAVARGDRVAQNEAVVRSPGERCGECKPSELCANHIERRDRDDAGIAAEMGKAWATWVRHEVDVRRPWPRYEERAIAIATRLVRPLASRSEARRARLAEICNWQADLTWDVLVFQRPSLRDRPYAVSPLGDAYIELECGMVVRFRARRRSRLMRAESRRELRATFTVAKPGR